MGVGGERHTLEVLLAISEERHRLLAEHANDVIWTMGIDGSITYVSAAVEAMRGITPEEACRQSIEQIHPPESAAVSQAYFVRLADDLAAGRPPQSFRGELEYYCADGSTVWTEVQVIPHIGAEGEIIEILGVTRDISERKRHVESLSAAKDAAAAATRALQYANVELRRLAMVDDLTGAYNRRQCGRLLQAEVERAVRSGGPVSLLMLDLDHFKRINDVHGHQAGDEVLVEVTRRLSEYIRSGDTLARWGGEEFLVVLPSCGTADATALAEQVRRWVAAEPFGTVGAVTLSIGVAEYVPPESADQWIRRADQALYVAKANGRNVVRVAR